MQEPKYEFREGKVYNRASGEVIPDDEPIMVFRGRDKHAVRVLENYQAMCSDTQHFIAVDRRIRDFRKFRADHPERMKEPDTDLGPATAG